MTVICFGSLSILSNSSLNAGDIICLKEGHPYEGKVGIIVERTFEILPPGTNLILVYKVLLDSIIINVPLKWMVQINTHPSDKEN
jgi:hypothetical protein